MRTGSRAALALTLCCTAAALTGCGGAARDGYLAVGAAAPGPERGAGENVAPRAGVEFQPLAAAPPEAPAGSSASASVPVTGTPSDTGPTMPAAPGSQPPGSSGGGGGTATAPGGSAPEPGTPPAPGRPATPGGTPPGQPGTTPGTPGTPVPPAPKPGTGTPKPPTPTPPPPPATAAKLSLSAPTRAAASERRCERVTVTFTNTGGTAARSGTVGFETHIIGALGIDWATIRTTQPLPGPIAAGATRTQTYTVCVEAWRVPLGMRVETRNVTASWI
ncbi:hypothetical protein NJL88_09345 [Streptomyces sp. DK15]|uniref:hypothetical protein n=1 Tax=Streptomyces sp. DK15 TaxID=2957499 RepID=UPI0029AE33D3|nr:hypothetical protein [Streptomyces sp. DK15]MDX2390266.1 hypothetical protein [Streptomyces sp. DK15]